MSLPIEIDAAHGLAICGGEPHVFHCHHYNCVLQKAVDEAEGLIEARALQVDSAADVVFSELQNLKSDRAGVEEVFSTFGFGRIDLSGLTSAGGKVRIHDSHYAHGWLSRHGKADRTICHFPTGFIVAAANHLHGGQWSGQEISCVARGDAACVVEVSKGGNSRGRSPGVGVLSQFPARPALATKTSVNEAAIIQACGGLPLSGNAQGRVEAFGVSLTRHFSNYYNLVSFGFDRLMAERGGPAASVAARMQLVEAGRVCAFHTFGGIMESAEWEALIKPQCATREDWIFGMVAVVNALGWGRWSVAALEPGRRMEMVVDGSYESNGHLAMHPTADSGRCWLATGGTAGLMNLVYNADITKRPDLTREFYEKTFQSKEFFVANEVECRAQGAASCRIVAERI